MKNPDPIHVVIVGGVAGGASAAARLRRLDEFARITVVERGPDVSFANCGLPYFIGGEIQDRSRLAIQTPASLAGLLAIDVRTGTEAVRIDRDGRKLHVRRLADGVEEAVPYDRLILAPGASPLRPPLPGIDDPRILTLRNLQDMDAIREQARGAKRALVIGAGFIGLEMSEQLVRLGLAVEVAELTPQVLPQMDPGMTRLVEDALRDNGVVLHLGDGIRAFEADEGGLSAVLGSGKVVRADFAILSIGVRPESGLAAAAGLELGERGHVRVDSHLRTSDPAIYAVGDVAETTDAVLGGPAAVPLGGPANRQGRVAAEHIARGDAAVPYPGSIGTAIVRVFDAVAAVTGWTEKHLRAAGLPFQATTVSDFGHASYYPGAVPVSVKLLWRPEDGRLLGAQVVGSVGVDKRIDVLATAILGGMTIDQLTHLELAYAPPFGSAKDPVNIAGFSAGNIRDGLFTPLYEIPSDGAMQVVDVRPAALFDLCPTEGARNIPLPELRGRLDEIDRTRPVATVCALGKTSYFAARILRQHGFDARGVIGGIRVCRDYKTPFRPPVRAPEPGGEDGVVKVDATGVSCPGPILNLQRAFEENGPGAVVEISATDPDFFFDLSRFCEESDLVVLDYRREAGILTARVTGRGQAEAGYATI